MLLGFQDIGYSAFYPVVMTCATRDQIRHWLATICYRKTLSGFNPTKNFRKLCLGVVRTYFFIHGNYPNEKH